MERFIQQPCDPRQFSPLTLAFMGDAVFEMFVRERLVCQGNCSVNKLHKRAVEQVCCQAQAAAAQSLLPLMTEEEQENYRLLDPERDPQLKAALEALGWPA